ncbi:MAG TPA: 2-oxo acid dehydrogenase subunit E2 [Ktedonobacteraceae bacterium]|nr:2-oxo acid dehydrogenase subunit E2 [Ktedonobacteraceae bacterium]
MKQKHADYKLVPYPKSRRFMAAARRSVQGKPMMHGLIEVDVTRARAFLRDHKAKTGEALSFTAFIVACAAKAVDENKAVHATRFGRKHLIVFEDVDVMTYIERTVAGQKEIMPYIIRAANRKTFREIHQEIRAAQVEEVAKAVVGFKLVQLLPIFLFRFFLRMVERSPQMEKKYRGTVELSAVGMFGNGTAWGIPPAGLTLTITVGSIGERPGVVDGHIVMREYLSMTISFDHDIIDGAPAARFTQRLKELIESGYGLDGSTVASEQTVAEAAAKKS